MNQQVIDKLREAAQKNTTDFEDSTCYDICGGNYDDAYNFGWEDGFISCARQTLEALGEPY